MKIKLDQPTIDIWYIQKDQQSYGPFSYVEMIQHLQMKTLFPFDYAWNPQSDQWKRLNDFPEFHQERLFRVYEQNRNQGVFQERQHTRIHFQTEVVGHNHEQLWKGHSLQISKGGSALVLQNPMLVPGSQIFLHFFQKEINEPSNKTSFNASATVLSKLPAEGRIQQFSSVQYAVQFQDLCPESEMALEKIIQNS